MTAGRKSLPDNLKKIRGTDQPVRMNPDAPAFGLVIKVPAPPKWFSKLAKQIWKDTTNELKAKGILESIGIPILVSYCRSMANYLEAEQELAEIGSRIHEEVGKFGVSLKVHPLQKISDSELKKALSIAQEYGITPAAKARIKVSQAPKDAHDAMFD